MSKQPVVKVCGVRTVEGAQAAVDAGADLIGFICYPAARRFIPPDRMVAILRQLKGRSSVQTVGVFVNQSPAEIRAVMTAGQLDLVQLSGDEPPELIAALSWPVIKAIRPAVVADGFAFPTCRLHAALLEPPGAGWGGSGQRLDWSTARAVTQLVDRPAVYLAGGLNPENVTAAMEAAQPDGVDASSGLEVDGVQDEARIAAFVAAARGARRWPEPGW